jgi:hypothetical protein
MAGRLEVPEGRPRRGQAAFSATALGATDRPDAGIIVCPRLASTPPRQPLVVIGVCLTHGFQCGAMVSAGSAA